MKHIKFEVTIPNIITGVETSDGNLIYPTPASDFELGRLKITKGESVRLISHSIEIFLVFSGSAEVLENGGVAFKRNKGEAWVSFDKADSEVRALEDAVIYKASIPGMN